LLAAVGNLIMRLSGLDPTWKAPKKTLEHR